MGTRPLDVLAWLPDYGGSWGWPDVTPLLRRVMPAAELQVKVLNKLVQEPQCCDVVVSVSPQALSLPKPWTMQEATRYCAEAGIALLWLRFDRTKVHKQRVGGHTVLAPMTLELVTPEGRVLARCPVRRDNTPGLKVRLGDPSYLKKLELQAA